MHLFLFVCFLIDLQMILVYVKFENYEDNRAVILKLVQTLDFAEGS